MHGVEVIKVSGVPPSAVRYGPENGGLAQITLSNDLAQANSTGPVRLSRKGRKPALPATT